jgi:hypothetical protein
LRFPSCFPVVYDAFCFSTFTRVSLVFEDIIYIIIYTLFVTFGYLGTVFVRMCGINVHGHTCDEYSILA